MRSRATTFGFAVSCATIVTLFPFEGTNAAPAQDAVVEPVAGGDDSTERSTSRPEAQEERTRARPASRGGGTFGANAIRGLRGGKVSEARAELIISVVGDIAPDWAEGLRTQYQENPSLFGESIRPHARRLMGLGMLRDRNPELYAVRVAELALKRGLREKAATYHRILATDPTSSKLPALELAIRDLAKESVDLELRARAMELAALAEAVKEMKDLLLQETIVREARIQTLAEELLAESPESPSFDESLESLDLPTMPPRSKLRGSASGPSQVDASE